MDLRTFWESGEVIPAKQFLACLTNQKTVKIRDAVSSTCFHSYRRVMEGPPSHPVAALLVLGRVRRTS